MPTFTQVFQASGTGKNGKPYTRWDYKTANGERYAHFAGTQEIPLNVPVALETSPSGSIKEWKVTGEPMAAGNQQTAPELQDAAQAARTAPTAPQGDKPDWDAIARGKVKSNLWVALLPAMFSSLPKVEQTVEAAGQLVDYAMGEVFPEEIPF